ncbi:MAG: hypothetical protein HC819_05915 [Cyclobacteriaceae bacterium]|nr:hypothetical protein [Cyclobacteriaceae bacterium]
MQKLIDRGLDFDFQLNYSNDFVAISRYGGSLWEANWINYNGTIAWHSNCKSKQIERAVEIGELMTMEKDQELLHQGVNVFATIKSSIN